MKLKIYQADAFTENLFGGNPAAVVPLETWLDDDILQKIAAENNLSETAFIVPSPHDNADFHLRWLTPSIEVRLCGHATLATAHILFEQIGFDKPVLRFDSKSGILTVKKMEKGYALDFPADFAAPNDNADAANLIANTLGIKPLEILRGKDDFVAVLPNQAAIADLKPDFSNLKNLDARGLIATARGENGLDFVSRCFYPEAGIEEDPVTGSAHTALTPYWAAKLGKNRLVAAQISARRGDLMCTLQGDRVILEGNAVTYLVGEIFV